MKASPADYLAFAAFALGLLLIAIVINGWLT